jgi:hypothetical protein
MRMMAEAFLDKGVEIISVLADRQRALEPP